MDALRLGHDGGGEGEQVTVEEDELEDGTERAAAKASSEVCRRSFGREEGGLREVEGRASTDRMGELALRSVLLDVVVCWPSGCEDVTVFVMSSSGRRILKAMKLREEGGERREREVLNETCEVCEESANTEMDGSSPTSPFTFHAPCCRRRRLDATQLHQIRSLGRVKRDSKRKANSHRVSRVLWKLDSTD